MEKFWFSYLQQRWSRGHIKARGQAKAQKKKIQGQG